MSDAAIKFGAMKVGIYLEPAGDAVGGSELCAAVLAEEYGAAHEVDLIHHKPTLAVTTFERAFDVALGSTRMRYVEPSALPQFWGTHNPLERLARARAWQAELSAPYDLFVGFFHNVPPFCHAKVGVLVVLFPFFEREEDTIFRADRGIAKHVKRAYYQFEWRLRMRSYARRVSISQFTRTWTKRRWHMDTGILNPPGADPASRMPAKKPLVLSVGRFSVHAHTKKQDEMISLFGTLSAARAAGWSYRCVGGLSTLAEDGAFFERMARLAVDNGAETEANVSRARLATLFAEASIFWHATGLGVDEDARPELLEHYGIVTAEAMASGCVPVVINRGGQREIVQHGVDGFLWDTLDELREYTTRLVDDDALRQRMAAAALARAATLGRSAYVDNTRRLVAPLINGRGDVARIR